MIFIPRMRKITNIYNLSEVAEVFLKIMMMIKNTLFMVLVVLERLEFKANKILHIAFQWTSIILILKLMASKVLSKPTKIVWIKFNLVHLLVSVRSLNKRKNTIKKKWKKKLKRTKSILFCYCWQMECLVTLNKQVIIFANLLTCPFQLSSLVLVTPISIKW